ncbi:MAG: hypothetical protein ACI35O_03790 [Bacillaceae bacterium]
MLTFEQKLKIIESFPQLTRKNVSLNRVNFQYEESMTDKKNVVYHLHPNGNGFVYAGNLEQYEINDKGFTNIRNFSEEELREIITLSIQSLATTPKETAMAFEETWINNEGQTLVLIQEEEDMWNVYAGLNLDGTFTTYAQAKAYLDEEGFKLK